MRIERLERIRERKLNRFLKWCKKWGYDWTLSTEGNGRFIYNLDLKLKHNREFEWITNLPTKIPKKFAKSEGRVKKWVKKKDGLVAQGVTKEKRIVSVYFQIFIGSSRGLGIMINSPKT